MILRGLATGIGSFPHKDVQEALDLIFQCTPSIPFWPQLPKRDIREGMVLQFSENLPCLALDHNDLVFNPKDKEKELETFYENIIADKVDYFRISERFALGLHEFYQRLKDSNLAGVDFIKCQVTGPFSFAASIKDDKGVTLLHDALFFQTIVKGLAMKASWQIRMFGEFNKKIILFFDEPYLGCFGSAYTPINREDVIKGLLELTASIKQSQRVMLGLHCCGNTDWSIFSEVKTIDIISFDAFAFQERFILYADSLRDFLKNGGLICWGIVPTQEPSVNESAESLVGKLMYAINALAKKGVDKDLLLENLLISPACGLGALDTKESEQIFKLLREVSSLLRK